MHKIRVELTDLPPDSTDRLIRLLHDYMAAESEDIHLEVQDLGQRCAVVPVGNGAFLRLSFDRVLYAAADRHRTEFCLGGRTESVRINFSEAIRLFPEREFLVCSRGILLNLNHIAGTDGERFLMDNGVSFPIRRKGRSDILLRYRQFRVDSSAG